MQDLSGDGWTVRAVGDLAGVPEHIRGRDFPARVPGCVHLDLIRAGVLRHPNLGYAEREQEWVGRTDWRYELVFTPEPALAAAGEANIRFECLDTIATVELNGVEIGTAANYHTEHTFAAASALKPGENLLAITLSAPIPFVEREHDRLGRLPHNGDELGWHPFNMLRKPACNFGWDWGPRVATSGVQGPVCLSAAETPRAWASINRWTGTRWGVTASVRGELHSQAELRLSLRGRPVTLHGRQVLEGAQADEGAVTSIGSHLDLPDLWWPRGHGDQPLYDLELVNGDAIRRWRVGFSHATLATHPDREGSQFTISVHDQPIWCRGANWIPDALFPGEATPQRIRERVRQAADANMNMLRVWGGGAYEQDAFYEACNELGILVWQDFMFACAVYPTSDDHLAGIAREARQQSRRLASHPSLVLWCGGNECVEGYQHWGWKQRMGDTPSDASLYTETLYETLEEACGSGAHYWPNSPWSDAVEDVRDPDHGDRHTWDLQFEDVRKIVPRLVSEFGRVAPACERTLREAGVFEDASPATWPREAAPLNSDIRSALEHRLRQTGGSGVAYDPVLPEHFREPAAALRGWLWQTKVLQARALTTHIEWLRANAPRCMGALIWQLNDCWACQSWALIDHAGRPKPAWYAVRRAFQPRRVTIQPLGGDERLSAVLINDTGEAFEGECVLRRESFHGDVLAEASAPVAAGPRAVARVDGLLDRLGEPGNRAAEVLVAECSGDRDVWFWERDRGLRLPRSPLRAQLDREDDRAVVRLRADALARDVIIAADLLGEDARAAENCFTMLAGEAREVVIEGTDLDLGIDVGQVVRCASGPAK